MQKYRGGIITFLTLFVFFCTYFASFSVPFPPENEVQIRVYRQTVCEETLQDTDKHKAYQMLQKMRVQRTLFPRSVPWTPETDEQYMLEVEQSPGNRYQFVFYHRASDGFGTNKTWDTDFRTVRDWGSLPEYFSLGFMQSGYRIWTPDAKLVFTWMENNWYVSEEDIQSMFSALQKEDWTYADCVRFPDRASGCVGAVLFWDDEQKTTHVAFFDEDGDYQQCGIDARLADEPDFTYLGDGTVTFQMKTEDGSTYPYTIAISKNGSDVRFKTEDGLAQKQS